MSEQSITIIMSAYNEERFIDEAIQSILDQTFKNFKFVIVNNCSTDKTGSIIQNYSKKDLRIKYIELYERGTYVDGRTRAISEVKTDWFAIMDADDVAEPDRLEKQIEYIDKFGSKNSVFGTWGYFINDKGKKISPIQMGPLSSKEFKDLYKNNEAIVPLDPSTVIKKESFLSAGGYRNESVPAADLCLFYRIAEKGGSIRIIPNHLMRYRIHGKSSSVEFSMLQRLKTHFINFNMRRRRSFQKELTYEEFIKNIWSRFHYRLPRLRNDFGLVFFKKAGFSFASGKYLNFFNFLFLSFLIKPIHTSKRIFIHLIK